MPSQESELSIGASPGSILLTPAGPAISEGLQSFGIGVNEDEPDDVTGVGAGVK